MKTNLYKKCEFAKNRIPWKSGSNKTICIRPGPCPKGAYCIKPKELTSYDKLQAVNRDLLAALKALVTAVAAATADITYAGSEAVDGAMDTAEAAIARATKGEK